jgi:hypothetical protein
MGARNYDDDVRKHRQLATIPDGGEIDFHTPSFCLSHSRAPELDVHRQSLMSV